MNQVAIPQSANDWTLSIVESLVDADCYETEIFDFKEYMVHKDDPTIRNRIRSTACAFANSYGGFLVFGVADRLSRKKGRDRIVGLEKLNDLPKIFGDQLVKIMPTINFIPQNPPISIPKTSDKVIFVVHIPRSFMAPHVYQENEKYLFYKRTNTGNEPMTFMEIESSFASKLGIVAKLKLIHWQISMFATTVDQAYARMVDKKNAQYSLVVWEPNLLEYAICDAYPLIGEDRELLTNLNYVIMAAKGIRQTMLQLPQDIMLGKDTGKFVNEYNNSLKEKWKAVVPYINGVIEILKKRYGVTSNPIAEYRRSKSISPKDSPVD